ncbi:MAG: hypothetical protein E7440_07330 [Ruminococcaceae bacterium]|nr:hypothetical protein [Oscillospiraceae bacterium]
MDNEQIAAAFSWHSLKQIFQTEPLIGLLGLAVAGILLFFLLFGFVRFIAGFSKKIRYLNNEIRRTDGAERMYYIRCRRRMWLTLIPFVQYKNE